jgi:PAS domain S-box-containing protein
VRVPLRTRISLFAGLGVLLLGALSTLLLVSSLRTTAEREILARGAALGQALARAAAEGLAAEDLDLLDQAAGIVRAEDVLFAQVFSSIWSPVEAYPFEELRRPPAPEAVAHFRGEGEPFVAKEHARYDFYVPILFRLPGAPETTIGYARLGLSTAPLRQALRAAALRSLLIAAALAALFLALTHVLMGRTVVAPIIALHHAVALLKEGHVAGAPAAADRDDEIADLAREFHAMSLALRDREERLAEEKERLAVTLRSIGDGVLVADADGRVSLINHVAEELTGWRAEEAAGRPFCEVFAIRHERTQQPCANVVAAVLATGGIVSLPAQTALVRRDGTEVLIEDAAAPIRDRESQIMGVVLVFRDISEKRRIEAELLKSEKLQALGVLAGGIAHDFNNLLTGILGNIGVARMGLPPDDAAQARLAEAEGATRRASELTVQLLTFARGGAPVRRAETIADILRESARLVLAGRNVAAAFRVPEGVRAVSVDAGQMNQVFNNLTLNAAQAMPGGGTITYTVENAALGEGEIAGLAAGDYVRVSVADEGTGIAAENVGRIFDPYFTTREDGVGLGLSSAYSIVKRHGGHIAVSSVPGRGTTFRIWLPAAAGAAPAAAADTAAAAPAEEPPLRGRGAILVMDDEQVVRDVAAEILEALGYEAVAAANGEEALALYRAALERGAPYRAVVMDLTVPGGMGGKDAIGRLLALDPGARAIVSSGYSNDPVMADFRAYGFAGVVVKPYSVKTFARTLQEVLGPEREAARAGAPEP